jgi:hypothetical protein
MSSIKQTALGSGNTQITQIFNRSGPSDPVEICAEHISKILGRIAHLDFLSVSASRLRPPDILAKNAINCVDAANSIQIEQTYALWDEITESIGTDANGTTAADYAKASYVLNQLYLAKFQKDFPGFKIHALGIYFENTRAEPDEAHVLFHLMNYMYLSCQIGIVP